MRDIDLKNNQSQRITDRNPYVDFFRIVLMLMIVIHHSIVHGLGLVNLRDNLPADVSGVVLSLNAFVVVAVNCFFWISGFYKIQFRWKKFIDLLLEVVFYVIVTNIIVMVVGHEFIEVGTFIKHTIGFIGSYWFMAVYFALYILSPYLNRLIENITWKEAYMLALILLGVNTLYGFFKDWANIGTGYSLAQAIYIYLIGRVCYVWYDKINDNLKQWQSLGIYFVCGIAIAIAVIFLCDMGVYALAWRMYAYNNPLVVIAAVNLCMYIVKIERPAGGITSVAKCSPYALAIYLLSDYPSIRGIVFTPLNRSIDIFASNQFMFVTIIFLNPHAPHLAPP